MSNQPPETKPEHLTQWGELKTDIAVFIRIVFNFGAMIVIDGIAKSALGGNIAAPLSWGLTATEFGFFLSLLVSLLLPAKRVLELLKLLKSDLIQIGSQPNLRPQVLNKEK